MLDVENLQLRLGPEPLFDGISLRVNMGQRVALAGRNGQGKSTLMKIIMGQMGYDDGSVTIAKSRTLGYLPQDIAPPDSDRTVIAEALEAIPRLKKLEADVARLTEKMAATPDDASVLAAYGKALTAYESVGGYAAESNARTILAGLGFSQERMDGPLRHLSGGWLMRVYLAKLLLQKPDLLLLDEPTNHLDLESREWLLEYLQQFPGGLILTSHDRYFLDHLVQRVLLLESGKLDIYHGNYTEYEIKREEALEHLRGAFVRQQKELKKQQVFIEKNRARAATASNVQSRIKQVAKIEIIKLPPEPPKIKLRFPEPRSSGQLAFRLTEVGKAYGETQVISNIDLELPAGEKLAVVGVNGAGKTTLLKLITGDEQPTSGTLKLGHNILIQTFSQYANDLPNEDWSLLQAMEDAAPTDCTINRRTILGCFLFQNDDVHKQIRVLSGGERARLKLARMLMRPSNLLILDEPTNHLDLHSKDVLLNALQAFQGTVLFVSHDRDFLEALATSVLEIKEGKARLYPTGYQQYRWRVAQDEKERYAASAAAKAPAPTAQATPPKTKAKQSKEQRKQRSRAEKQAARDRKRELRKAKESVEKLQAELEKQEARMAELEALMAEPGFFDSRETSEPAVTEHKQLQMLIGAGYEELEAALERVEAAEATP